MYDKLISSLRICRRINSANGICIAFHDGSCEAEPVCMYELMEKAADAIENLQKQLQKSEADNIDLTGWFVEEHAKYQWIPVTERLPEQNGEYLVVYTLKAIPLIQRVEICSFAKNLRNVNKYDLPKNKPGFYQSDSEYGYYEITGVSHWMRLPEPPKGDE